MRARANHFVRTSLSIVLLASVTTGCWKDSTTPSSKGDKAILNDAILHKLPTATAGFFVIDLSGEAFKKLRGSPWGDAMNGQGSLKASIAQMREAGADEAQVKLAETAFDALQKLGLVSSDGASTLDRVISKGVAFVGPNSGQVPLDGGIFLEAAPSVSMKDKLPIIRASLSEAGLNVTEQQIAGTSGIVAVPPNLEGSDIGLFVAATDNHMGVTLSKATLETLFASTTTSTIETLRNLPEFKRAEAAVRNEEAALSFAFLSVPRLMPLLERERDENFDPQKLPVESIAFSDGFSERYVNRFAAAMTPRTEAQKQVLSAFEGAVTPAMSLRLPHNAAFSISINTSIFAKIKEVERSLQEQAGSGSAALIKEIQSLTLGARAASEGSPFPDIFIALDTTKPEQTAKSLEQLLSLGLMATGQEAQWSSKEIAGNPTRFFMTMFGAGAFISPVKNSQMLLLATSEKAITDLIASSADDKKGVTKNLSAGLQALAPASSLGVLYVNFPQVATIMDSLKGSLGMFGMAGNSEVDEALDSTKVKTLGLMLGDLSYKDGVFKLESAFELSKE